MRDAAWRPRAVGTRLHSSGGRRAAPTRDVDRRRGIRTWAVMSCPSGECWGLRGLPATQAYSCGAPRGFCPTRPIANPKRPPQTPWDAQGSLFACHRYPIDPGQENGPAGVSTRLSVMWPRGHGKTLWRRKGWSRFGRGSGKERPNKRDGRPAARSPPRRDHSVTPRHPPMSAPCCFSPDNN